MSKSHTHKHIQNKRVYILGYFSIVLSSVFTDCNEDLYSLLHIINHQLDRVDLNVTYIYIHIYIHNFQYFCTIGWSCFHMSNIYFLCIFSFYNFCTLYNKILCVLLSCLYITMRTLRQPSILRLSFPSISVSRWRNENITITNTATSLDIIVMLHWRREKRYVTYC